MEESKRNSYAVTSMILGIIGLIAWIIPLIGGPVAITALILGILGLQSEKSGMAIGGIVMSIISLVLTAINAIIGAYLVMSTY